MRDAVEFDDRVEAYNAVLRRANRIPANVLREVSTMIVSDYERSRLTVSIEQMIDEARKPLPWAVEKTLLDDSLNIIWGPPKQFKTFVALDLALSQATGLPFLGKYKVLKVGLVIYVAGEGVAGIAQRVLAWCIGRGISDINSTTVPFKRTVGAIQIGDGGAAALALEIEQIVADSNVPLVGIYIDTLARNFGTGDENSTKDMNTFIYQCDTVLKSRFKVPVVIVHHSGHGDKERPRGAIALMGAADTMTKVSCKFPKVHYEPNFAKDFETPLPHVLQIETIALGYSDQFGDAVSSMVLRMTDEAIPGQKLDLTGDQKIALKHLSIEWKSYAVWRDDVLFEAGQVVAQQGKNKGEKRRTSTLRSVVSRLVESLEKKGLIEVERCSEQNFSNIRWTRAAEALQL